MGDSQDVDLRQSRAQRSAPGALLVAYLDVFLLSVMTLILIAVIGLLNPAWFTLGTLQTAASQNAPLAIVAVAMTFSIISGNIDLSPGSMIALTGVIIGLVFQDTGNLAVGICAGFVFAIAVGLAHAVLVAWVGINAIIVTLAAYVWARGMAIGLTGANAIDINTPFINLMNTFSLAGVTLPIAMIIASYLLGWFLLNRTKMGRYTYAMGGDLRATERAGVNMPRQTMLIFAFMGTMIAVATVITISQVAGAQPLEQQGFELDAIIAVIVGGSKLTGGEGSVLQTLVGVLFITTLNNGLGNLGLPDANYFFIKGVIILLVLSLQAGAHRLVARRVRAQHSMRDGSLSIRTVGVS